MDDLAGSLLVMFGVDISIDWLVYSYQKVQLPHSPLLISEHPMLDVQHTADETSAGPLWLTMSCVLTVGHS